MQIDGQSDGAWVAVKLGCVSITESSIYIMAACLPIYRSLYRSVRERTESSFGAKGTYGSAHSRGVALRSIGKVNKEFSPYDTDDTNPMVTTTFTSSNFERLPDELGSPTDIKVERQVLVTSTKH